MSADNYHTNLNNLSFSIDLPGIFAFSGKNREAVKAEIVSYRFQCEKARIHWELAEQSRKNFNPDDYSRLVMVVLPAQSAAGCLDNAIAYMQSNENTDSSGFPGLFYGEGRHSGKVAFIFPGQGSQYVYMGRDLVSFFPAAKTIIDDMDRLCNHGRQLASFIFPKLPEDNAGKKRAEAMLLQTDVAQPAIGAISLAMTKILAGFLIFPEACAGHSFGELSALFAGKRIGQKDFLWLSCWRGQLMAKACGKDKGKMLAVKAPLEIIEQLVKTTGLDVVLANRNSPEQGVLSGSSGEIEKMQTICKKNKMLSLILPVSAAFHSRLVSDAADGFRKKIEEVDIFPESIPVYSNKTALPYPANHHEVRRLLGEHLVSPVNFTEQIKNMHADGVRFFIEVGPKNVLSGLVHQILKGLPFSSFSIDASSGKKNGLYDLGAAISRLAAAGYPVDLKRWGKKDL